MARTASVPADPLRGRRYLEQFCGISPSTRRRWQQAGIIPPADRVIAGKPYWFESTLRVLGRPGLSSMAPDATPTPNAVAEPTPRGSERVWRPTPRRLG